MTALTPDDLARIEELAEKADALAPNTIVIGGKREWTLHATLPNCIWLGPVGHSDVLVVGKDATAAFIAEARSSVPALVAGVRSLQARITELDTGIAARDTVIQDAPHAMDCMTGANGVYARLQGLPADCDCWKSHYPAGADHE